ncbi:MAG TPA: hypothetical protein VG166_14965 [Caulobacteraceae bacterium]|jgi:hypothetical protein|nr:hypothetical protein [Caulobacteraceae bacterium]
MATIDWISTTGGNWSNAADWYGGVVPGYHDDAVIAAGTASYTVTITAAEAVNSLTVNNSHATVSIASGGAIGLGSDLNLDAGVVTLGAGGVISGGTIIQNGGSIAYDGATLEGVTVEGTLNLRGAGSSVTIAGAGIVLTGAGGSGPGAISVPGDNSYIFVEGNQTLDNAAAVFGDATGLEQVQTSSAPGTLTLGPNFVFEQAAGVTRISDVSATPGDECVNQGTIEATTNGIFFLEVVDFVNEGVFLAGNGAIVSIIGPASFENAAGGTLDIEAGEKVATGTVSASFAGLLTGGGNFAAERATISGLTVGGGSRFVDYGTVTQTGALTLGDGAGGTGRLTIEKNRTYLIAGSSNILRGTSTASRVVVSGTLDKTSGGGLASVAVAVSNAGVIGVTAGVLDFTQAITGAGAFQIGAGATLRFGGRVAATLTATFEAAAGTLALTRATAFDATIAGFAPGDEIDLINKKATTVSLQAGDKLLVQNGSVTVADLQLAGDFTGDTFNLTSDGKGGTNIAVSSGPVAAHALTQAMAAVAAPPAPAHAPVAVGAAHPVLLAAPAGH